MTVQSCQKKNPKQTNTKQPQTQKPKPKKALPTAKEQVLTLTASELPPTSPAFQETVMEIAPRVPALSVTHPQALGPVGPPLS